MAIRPLIKEDGKTLTMKPTNSTAFTKFSVVHPDIGNSTGLLIDGSLVADLRSAEFISLESKTSGATDTEKLLVLRVDPSIPFEVDLKEAITILNVGTTIDIENSTHLDPTATTGKIFTITNLVPANTSKAIGYFNGAIT